MPVHVTHRRQYERRDIDVRVALTVAETCCAQVTPTAGPTLTGRMTNISAGGAHVIVSTYLPRAVQVELELPTQGDIPAGRIPCRVMSVRMVDQEPRYGVGLRFEDPGNPVVQALQQAERENAL
jgi:c-di-GMP-binding flagellar brake protein YcgR